MAAELAKALSQSGLIRYNPSSLRSSLIQGVSGLYHMSWAIFAAAGVCVQAAACSGLSKGFHKGSGAVVFAEAPAPGKRISTNRRV